MAVRFRIRLKKATPCLTSGFAFSSCFSTGFGTVFSSQLATIVVVAVILAALVVVVSTVVVVVVAVSPFGELSVFEYLLRLELGLESESLSLL